MKRLVLLAAATWAACSGGSGGGVRVQATEPGLETIGPDELTEAGQVSALPVLTAPKMVGFVAPLAPPPPSCAIVVERDPPTAQTASTVRLVTFRLTVRGEEAGNRVLVEFVTPSGIVYEQRSAALTGTRFDVQQRVFELPVAGTVIDTGSLTGRWTARCSVESRPLGTADFDLL